MKPEVLILGTVGVRRGEQVHHPSSGPARTLLALPAEAGSKGVTAERIEDTMWGELVSTSALKVAMHRLRGRLRDVAGPGPQVASAHYRNADGIWTNWSAITPPGGAPAAVAISVV